MSGADTLPSVRKLEGSLDTLTVGDMWEAAGTIRLLYDALAELVATDPDGETWQSVKARAALSRARGEQVQP